MATALTFQNLFDYVDNILPKEGWKPNRVAIMAQCNAALDRFYCRDGEWKNQISLTGKHNLHIPMDCMNLDEIYYNGDRLEKVSQSYIIDNFGPDYRTDVTTPTCYTVLRSMIEFNCTLSDCPALTVLMQGVMSVGRFSEDGTAENPLLYVPQRFQILPAYYVLAFGTINANDPSMVDIKNTYRQLWETEYREMMAGIDLRSGGEFLY